MEIDADAGERKGPWRVLAKRVAFDNPWLSVIAHDVVRPDGEPGHYGVVSFKNLAIGVLPVFADGTIAMVGQFRFAIDAYSWELPEGGGARDVPPVESAKRELREETGLTAGRWRELIQLHTSNSITDEHAICFLATDLDEGPPQPDADEVLTQKRVPFADALEEVTTGAITDALTVAMLLRAHHMAVTGALEPHLAQAIAGDAGKRGSTS